MPDLVDFTGEKLYPKEFKELGAILGKHLPEGFDFKPLQIKLIDRIDLARGKVPPDIWQGIARAEKQDNEACDRLNVAIKGFKETFNDPAVIRATWQKIVADLDSQGVDRNHINLIFASIEKASQHNLNNEAFSHQGETRGAKPIGKNMFAFYVAEQLAGQLRSLPTARLVCEILESFGVESKAETINSAFERKKIFTK